ncbi:hypothetical protein Tco_1163113 [Tanacetum coccineum]
MNGKKIIINESTVRRDLQLEDAEGVDCIPNATIFEQLTLMGYEKLSQKLTFYKSFFSPQWKFLIHTILQCLSAKTTAWNKFSSTMASAIICLATNQKFNFSKYIFESMMKNLENVSEDVWKYEKGRERIFWKRNTLISNAQEEMGEGSANPTDPHHTPTIIQPSKSKPQKKQKPRKPKRKDIEVPQPSSSTEHVADDAVYKEVDDILVRVATTASSLEVEQDSGNINKTRSKATLNEPNPQGTSSGSGPRCQETMGDIIAQTRFENISKTSNDSLLAGVNTSRSDEDSMKLKELMEFCTKLQQRVLDLENTKTAQAQEITSLKLRVKKLEKKGGSRTHKLKRLYKVGRSARIISFDESSLGNQEDASKQGRKIDDIDKDAEITLVDETQGRYGDDLMFDTSDLAGEEVFVAEQGVPDSKKDDVVSTAGVATTVSAAATTVPITPEEITLA